MNEIYRIELQFFGKPTYFYTVDITKDGKKYRSFWRVQSTNPVKIKLIASLITGNKQIALHW